MVMLSAHSLLQKLYESPYKYFLPRAGATYNKKKLNPIINNEICELLNISMHVYMRIKVNSAVYISIDSIDSYGTTLSMTQLRDKFRPFHDSVVSDFIVVGVHLLESSHHR